MVREPVDHKMLSAPRPKRRRGSQKGNRNAMKQGLRCAEVMALRGRIRAEVRALRIAELLGVIRLAEERPGER